MNDKRKGKVARKSRKIVVIEHLQPRVLYSADVMPGLSPDLEAEIEVDGHLGGHSLLWNQSRTVSPEDNLVNPGSLANPENLADPVLQVNLEGEVSIASELSAFNLDDHPDGFSNSEDDSTAALVFIDERTPDYQALIADIQQNNPNTAFKYVLLESTEDGLKKITDTLLQYESVAEIHIVSHGSAGEVQLGGVTLNDELLASRGDELSLWSDHLTQDADILFYGCDLASTEEGMALVDDVAQLTGADIASSDDVTGHKDLGGDWELEYIVGDVESDVVFSDDVQQYWFGTLATTKVTTLDDVVDGDTSSVTALNANAGADGVVSLREAIIAANSTNTADVIELGSGVHTLSITGADASSGDLDLTSEVEIIGMADGSTVIDANGLGDRVFDVNSNATLKNLTITGGSAIVGGGININTGATGILDNVIVTDNTSQGSGGGISSVGSITVTNSTIDLNTAGTIGGGIASSLGSLELDSVTISNNSTGNDGGGVYLRGGAKDLTNITVSGNIADEDGGGIAVDTGSTTNLNNATIHDNTADARGGGLYVLDTAFNFESTVNVSDSIIAGNQGTTGQDQQGPINFIANNIIDDTTGLLLGALADNGGDVKTHELMSGSIAIATGAAANVGETDGRGFFVNDSRDIGAFEFGAIAPNEAPSFEVPEPPTFTEQAVPITDGNISSIVTADLDGDGDLDLVAGDFRLDRIVWHENDGNGNFTARTVVSNAFVRSVVATDLDGDGDLDLVSASSNDDTIAWYENDGTQNFTRHEIEGNVDGAFDVTTADVDGDGDIDVLSASLIDDSIVWYENDGSQGFNTRVISSGLDGAITIDSADFDGDGDLDVVAGGSTSDTVVWYENDGAQGFTERSVASFFESVRSVVAADIDGDGDVDLAAAAFVQDEVVWFENNGNGGFTEHSIDTDASGATDVVVADVDADGNLDVLATLAASNEVVWYENNGTQSFTAHAISNTFVQALAINTGDLNNDGRLDVVATTSDFSGGMGLLSWYENNGFLLTNTLDGNPTFTEGGMPVVLDADVAIFDPELSALNGGSDDFGGTTLTIERSGGTNSDDVFSAGGMLSFGTTDFFLDTATVGTFTNSAGKIELTFAPGATNIEVNQVMQSLEYSNSSNTPPASVDLVWTFDDGSQGGGGALQASGITIVNITAVNDAPVLTGPNLVFTTITEDDINNAGMTIESLLLSMGVSDRITDVDAAAQEGIAIFINNGNSSTWQYSLDGGQNWTDVGAVSQASALLLRDTDLLRLNPNGIDGHSSNLGFRAWDQTVGAVGSKYNIGSSTGGITAFSSNTASAQIRVTDVNDAPVLSDLDTSPLRYTEQGQPIDIASTLSFTDIDDTILASAWVTVTHWDAGKDVLNYTIPAGSGITATFDANIGSLLLSGPASVADFQSAFRSITFENNSDDPSATTRMVSFQTHDGTEQSAPLRRDIIFTSVNDEPRLSTIEAMPAVYTESSGPLGITGNLQLADDDDTDIESATVSITTGFAATEDELTFNGLPGVPITGSYNSNTGELILTGSATVAQYQEALTTVAYQNNSNNPSIATRTVSFTINDGDLDSNTLSRDIVINPVNNPPTLSSIETTPAAYTENDLPLIITGNTAVGDVDDTNIESASAFIGAGFAGVEDNLIFVDQAGIAGAYDANTGELILTGSATLAQYQTALQSITYENTSKDPSDLTRTVSFTINDGDADSNTVTRDISFTPVNDAPSLSTIESLPAIFVENSGPLGITGTLTLNDVDDIDIESATVSISSNFTSAEDELLFTNQSGITGSWDATTGVLTLTGSASVADYQTVLTSVAYSNTSNNPSALTRTITFEINDGDLDSNSLTRDIAINPVNNPPTLSSIESTPAEYTENDLPLIITGNTSVGDIDDTNIESASVFIGAGFAEAEDNLIFIDQADIAGAYDANTGELILTGSATLAQYQAALQSITYENTSEDPSDLTRTVSFTINDGDADSNTVTRDIGFTPVNDAPSLSTIESLPALFVENSGPLGITGNLTLSDVDDINVESATVSISNNFTNTEDELLFTNQSGITGFWDATTGVLTLTGSASVADYQTALTSVAYSNTNNNLSVLTRTITFEINDGELDSNVLSRDVEVFHVIELDIAAPSSITTDEDIPFEFTGAATVSVDDGVADDIPLQVTLSVANGGLTLSGGHAGVTFIEGSNGDGTIVIEGLESQLNAALTNLTYSPDADYFGGDTLNITTATSAGLIGYYTFDDGTANDVSLGSAQNGTLQGNAVIIPTSDPNRGSVLSLDGVDDRIEIDGVFGEPASVTLAAWVNLTSADPRGADVISLGNNIQLQLDTGGKLQGAYFNGNNFQFTEFPITLAGTGWHHVAFSYDADNRQQVLYLDGIAVAVTNNVFAIAYGADLAATTLDTTTIGRHGGGNRDFDFNGQIDDARIYTRALDATEIASLATDQTTTTNTVTSITVNPINDVPELSGIEVLPVMVSEGGSPIVVTSNVSVADVDDTNIESAIVSISSNLVAGDVLNFVNQNGITGSYDATNGVLTLTGSALLSDYQNALRSITYGNNGDDPSDLTRTVSILINDGDVNSKIVTRDINFTAVNDAPTLANFEVAPASFTEGGSPVSITANLSLDDPDDSNIESAIVGISSSFAAGDVLNFVNQNGITGSYDATNGMLTLTGSASLSDYQNALRSITYGNNGDDPSDLTRTVFIRINDGDVNSNIVTRDINFTAVNNAPTLANIETAPDSYTEGGSTVGITANLSVDDLDDGNIESAIVSISGNLAADDVLNFNNQNGITGNYSSANGTLTLTGSASLSDYETALRSITYENTGDDPLDLTRTVTFQINDGDDNSNLVSRDINFTAVNDAPTLANIEVAPVSFIEGGSPVGITGNLTLDDLDDDNIESATVSISSNLAADDVLNFTNRNGITGNYNAANGTLALTGSASLSDYQAALRSITYENTSDDPSDLTRTVTLQINDGDANGNFVSRDISFTAVNDAPTLANIEVTPALYTEGDSPLRITTNLSLDDLDDSNIESASVAINTNLAADDVLDFTNQNGITGNYNAANGTLTLTGSASLADYQAALQSITYENTSEDPSDLTRTVSFTINDGDADSNTVTRDISFTAINDAPVLSSIETQPAIFIENSGPLDITGNLTLSDVDDINIESATVSISSNFASAEDELLFTNQSGITGFWDATTGVLTLMGSASVADYQTALTDVTYSNTSNNPSALTRTITFEINDGDLDSNTLTRDIVINPVNNSPTLSSIEATPAEYAENDLPLIITGNTSVGDVDDTNIESATVSITGNFAIGEDELGFTSQSGIIGFYDNTSGTLTLNGSASLADYQTVLQSITYHNTSNNPSDLTRVVSFTINDGDADSNTVTRDISFTSINDAPVLSSIETLPAIFVENSGPLDITGNLTLNDIDDIDIESATVSISGNFVPGHDILEFTDQAGISGFYNPFSGVLSLTGSATVAQYQTALRSIEYSNTNENSPELTRIVSFEINDGDDTSNTLSRDIEFVAVNNAPALSGIETTPVVYTENDLPLTITGLTSVADVDDTNIESATVSITGNFANGDDVLGFTSQSGITGFYDNISGTLTLSGSASLADYQTVLQSITYHNTSDDPSDLARTVVFTINDGDADSNTVTRDINFTVINDAPVLSNIEVQPAFYTENAPPLGITGNLTLTDVDDINIESASIAISGNFLAGEDELSVTLDSSYGITASFDSISGVMTLSGTSSVANYETAIQAVQYQNLSDNPTPVDRTVTITVNDGSLNSNITTRTLDITPINDAPTTTPVTLTAVAEDNARLVTQAELLANASDIEGDGLTAIGLVINTGNGTLADNGDGTWSYTPAANDDTDVGFAYTVTDGFDNVAGSAVLDIAAINDPPTTAPVTLTTIAEDGGTRLITQAELLANANDIEGDGLTAIGLIINTGIGTLIDNGDGTWSYTPAADDDTDVTFAYRVTDGAGNITGDATLDISSVNDTPTAAPTTLTAIAEDSGVRVITQAELLANAGDIEGDGLTAVGLIVNAGNGTLINNGDGTWSYTPSADDDTDVSFAYTVTDGADNVTGSATLDITPVNDAPTTAPVTLTATAEDSGVRLINQAELLANANDIEGDGITAVGLIINAGNGTLINNGDGTWSYTPSADDDTEVSFAYTVTDGADNVAGSAILDITPVNDAPTTAPVTLTAIAEDSGVRLITQAELLANAGDIEGNSLSAAGLMITAGNGILTDNNDGTWSYTPAANDDTDVSFDYTVADGTNNIAGSATLNITAVNDPPEGNDSTVQTPEDTSYILSISDFPFTDVRDGNEFSGIYIVSLPVGGMLTLSGVPAIIADFIDARDIENGALVFTPDVNHTSTGTDTLEYLLRDTGGIVNGGNDVDPQPRNITFDVNAINDAPQIITNIVTLDEGDEQLISNEFLSGSDVDDSPQDLTYTLETQPDNGALSLAGVALNAGDQFTLADIINNQLHYVHDGSETSADFLDLSLADGGEDGVAAALGRLAFIINEVIDQAPRIENDQFSLAFGEAFSSENGDLLASGSATLSGNLLQENEGFTLTIEEAPEQGTLEVDSNGNFNYRHNESTILQDEFTYRVTNEDGIFTLATVSISIEPPIAALIRNELPVDLLIPAVETITDSETETPTEQELEVELEVEQTEEQTEEQVEPPVDDLTFEILNAPQAEARVPDQQAILTISESLGFERNDQSNLSLYDARNVIQHNKVTGVLLASTELSVNNSFIEITIDNQSYGASNADYLRSLANIDRSFSESESKERVKVSLTSEALYGITFSATAVILSWVLRGGALLAGALASTPIWTSIDPVTVFNSAKKGEKEESDEVESMFEDK